MIVDVACAVASILLLLWSMATHPASGHCPDDWWVNGVRPSGWYGCRPRSLVPDVPSRGHERDQPDDPDSDHEVYAYYYCTGGQQPIVVDYRTVGCMMPH